MPDAPQQWQPRAEAPDAEPTAVSAGPGVPHHGPGAWQRITGGALVLIAVLGCLFALWPAAFRVSSDAVSLPEAVLALSASAFVGGLYFFLSAQVRRGREESRRLTKAVEQRTSAALSSLKQDVESLQDAVARRTQERIAATDEAARDVAERPTTDALSRLLDAAARHGLAQEGLRVALKRLVYLSIRKAALESGHSGGVDDGDPVLIVEVAEAATDRTGRVRSRQVVPGRPRETLGGQRLPELGRDPASVVVRDDQSLSHAFGDLEDQLRRRQLGWKAFPEDAERAFRRLSDAVDRLSRAMEQADEPLELGFIEMVLDDEHVLMQPPTGHLTLTPLADPSRGVELSPVALKTLDTRLGEGDQSEAIYEHPFIEREVRYLRSQAAEADKLRVRKRASGMMRPQRPN